ncbi:MAG: hypothetical protein IKF58_16615 [Bacillus sp. (in: Bacteria)]|nr:hypothetical protein [Bacillus sp. (in: firmicutes)]
MSDTEIKNSTETNQDILKALQEDVAQLKALAMNPPITKKQILEENDSRKRLKLIKENIHLFTDDQTK